MVAAMRDVAEVAARAHALQLEAVAEAAAIRVLAARQMLANIKEHVADAEQAFKDTAKLAGVETVTLADGTMITRVEADRRTIDAGVLADTVTATVYDSVTTKKVVHKKFDAAVELGTIDKKVIKAVVTTTPYVAIRVTNP